MRHELSKLTYELGQKCIFTDNTTEIKAVCDEVAKLPLDDQLKVIYPVTGKYVNNLLHILRIRPTNFIYFYKIVERLLNNEVDGIVDALEKLLIETDEVDCRGTALANAIGSIAWEVPTYIPLLCNLIKKIPKRTQLQIFNQFSSNNSTLLNAALEKVYYYRNPKGGSNELYPEYWDKTIAEAKAESHAFFDAAINPLLDIMKDFPLEIKEEIYSKIPKSLWYLNRFPEEKIKIRNSIGVHRPFNSLQKTFFTLGAGTTLTGGALWILMTTSIITSSTFITTVWPIAITATVIGMSTMLTLNLYAKYNNPLKSYVPELRGEEKPLLGDNNNPEYNQQQAP